MSARGIALLGVPIQRRRSATFTCTTTGAQTLTLRSFDVATGRTVRVYWGDGTYNDYTGTGTRTHAYSGAGTWTVTVDRPDYVTKLDLRDTKLSMNSTFSRFRACTSLRIENVSGFNSQHIAGMALTYLLLSLPVSGNYTFDSQHIAGMALTYLYLHLSASGSYTFDSQHIAGMALTYLYLYPSASGSYTFDSQHIAGMALTSLHLYLTASGSYTFDSQHIASRSLTTLILQLHAASTTFTTARSDWSGTVVRAVTSPTLRAGLTQAQVDAVLLGIYDGAPYRTVTGGTLDVAGSNAAPSGVLQAACPPTTGKEAAYELVNDTCGVIPAGKEYAAVTINT